MPALITPLASPSSTAAPNPPQAAPSHSQASPGHPQASPGHPQAPPAHSQAAPTHSQAAPTHPKTAFFLLLLLCATGLVSPPLALLLGIAFALLLEVRSVPHPFTRDSAALARTLLQVSVIALGFGMNLREVLHAGRSGLLYTAIGITVATVLGLTLGRLLRIPRTASLLITMGTAICGGSAIAAIAPVADASEEEISVSMGTVFLLNAVALFLFPFIGHRLHLSQSQFGLWSALAIHDTSSVVGATARYGAEALSIGTAVKLARALWIIPISLAIATLTRRRLLAQHAANPAVDAVSTPRIKLPWFILFFCLAAGATSLFPRLHLAFLSLTHLGHLGLTATLFLIGTGLSRRTLQRVGPRPLLQGVALWIVVGSLSLAAIHAGWIHL